MFRGTVPYGGKLNTKSILDFVNISLNWHRILWPHDPKYNPRYNAMLLMNNEMLILGYKGVTLYLQDGLIF